MLKIDEKKARRLYAESPDWFKGELVAEFGEKFFQEKFWEAIKTFDDACKACGTSEKEFNEKYLKLGLSQDTINYEKAKICVAAINQGWVPDFTNDDQRKWYPWFNLSSGFGFVISDYSYALTYAIVGSRLCFPTQEQCEYCATQFLSIYKDFLT
jgi:hypothetical protein